jgi:hypothetical protein
LRSTRSNQDTLVRLLVRSEGASPLVVRSSRSRDMVAARMDDQDPAATAFLLVERLKTGEPVWAVKWRSADGERVRRRLRGGAWVERDGDRWRPRGGRPPARQLSEFQARRRMLAVIREVEAERAAAREAASAGQAREEAAGGPTFRALAHTWLEHVEFVKSAKPATMRDYRSMLAEPGTPYRRGRGHAVGRIMKAFGDLPAAG